MVKVAITKGRIEKQVCELLKKSGFDTYPIENKKRKLKIKTKDDIEIIFAKPKDVLSFTNNGVVDIGIVGKDTLDEEAKTSCKEVLDLNIGKCFFALASYPKYADSGINTINKIATKYPNIAKSYFKEKQKNVEIIEMDGSVELGPIIGVADAIVDIVETGSTLKANGLVVLDKISDISTRMIVNNNSLQNKEIEINNFVNKINTQM